MVRGKTVSLIIPCKNESKSLPKLLRRVSRYVDEIVVVDNNSTDDTVDVAKGLGAKVVLEKRKDFRGIGYGYAHRAGMKESTGDYLVTMDGDGTYPMGAIGGMIRFMVDHDIDFVTCSRFPLINKEAISLMRQMGVLILNTEVQVLYGYPMRDILSGMWGMNRQTVEKMDLVEGGWDLSPEIKLEALIRQDISFAQYHIDHRPRDNGASKQKLFVTGFNHAMYVLRRRLSVDNPIKLMLSRGEQELRALKL